NKRYNEEIKKLKSEYGNVKRHKEDYFNFVNDFITNIENIIGHNININGENIYLRYDTFIVDHDHNGYHTEKPLIISEKDTKMNYKKDHPFFKTDVIYYTNRRLDIDIFYNSSTYLLLGYKERNKEFEYAKKNAFIKINYSV